MLTLFVTLVASVGLAYLLSTSILTSVPLYFAVLVSILVGVMINSAVSVVNWIKTKLTIHGQRGELKKTYKSMGEMQQRLVQLEDENKVLREQLKSVVIES